MGLLLIFFCSVQVWAEYGARVWTVDNGLPGNEVRGVIQTPSGYIWIATLDGLVRFDGVRFTLFNKGNSPGITSSRFTALARGRDGDFWAVYESGGILRYHNGRFRTYDEKDGISGSAVSMVTTDSSGHVWVLSSGHVAQWNDKTDRFELSPNLNERIYGPLVWDSEGFVAFDQKNVYTFSKGRYEVYQLPQRLEGKRVMKVGLDQDHSAWLTMSGGELVCLGSEDLFHSKELSVHEKPILHGPDGRMWAFTTTSDMVRSITAFVDGTRRDVAFRYAFPDNQGNLWLASDDGLYCLQEQIINAVSIAQGLPDRDIYPIYQDASGAIWIGAWHKGLSKFEHGTYRNYTMADGLPNLLITSIGQDRSGRIWIATHGGLITYQDGRFADPKAPHVPDDVVQAIHEDKNGMMWFGSRFGVSTFKGGVFGSFPESGDATPIDVHAIAETPNGDLWFGGSNGLTRLRNGKAIRWTEANGLGSNSIWSLYADADGTVWVGAFDGGLVRIKDDRITRYTTINGLYNDGVFQILDDGLGNLWMSCNLGIYRVSKRELNEFAEGIRSTITSVAYGKADGLPTLQSNGGSSPAGTRTKDGKLWFPTQNGVAVVDPSKVHREATLAQVSIESMTVDQVPASIDAPVVVTPSKNNLQIQYTAPDFIRPDQLRFRYRLDGLDQEWTDAGTHRSASFTHLPPGNYQFLVSAKNEMGVWSSPGKAVAIRVLAPFYKTRWFEALLLLSLALAALAAWFRHHIRIKAKQALQRDFMQQLITSQEDERKRIAGELHDSLGQRLVVINSTAKLALRFRNNSFKSDETMFEEISAEAMAGLEDTRTIAYDLRPTHLDRLGLTQSIDYLVHKASDASNIPMASELDNIDGLLPPNQWINLYRIVQEAIGNVIKYSSASDVRVTIQRDTAGALLTIQDDGVGFVVDATVNKMGRIGMGLRGMAERASLLGARFSIVSAPGKGTTITIRMDAVHKG